MNLTPFVIAAMVLAWVVIAVFEAKRVPPSHNGTRWIRYGVSVRAIGLISVGTALYVLVSQSMLGDPISAIAGFLLLGVFGIPVCLLSFFWRVGYDGQGIYCNSPWRKARSIPWNDVERVRLSNIAKQWVIKTKGQGNIRINQLVPGASQMISDLKRRGVHVSP